MSLKKMVIRKVLAIDYNLTPINWDTTWESIELEEGVEKPPKVEFDKKVSDFINFTNTRSLRKRRNQLLDQSDKYIVADYPHPTEETKQAWLDYRQALRDLPANTTDPENPVWPVAPN